MSAAGLALALEALVVVLDVVPVIVIPEDEVEVEVYTADRAAVDVELEVALAELADRMLAPRMLALWGATLVCEDAELLRITSFIFATVLGPTCP